MKALKLISYLMAVAASTLLTSCLLLESSPIDHRHHHRHYYDYEYESDEYISDIEYADIDNTYCRVCSCKSYRGMYRCVNSVCVCGHSAESHAVAAGTIQAEFAVFVPAQDLIDAYKEAVELDPNKGNPDAIQRNEVYTSPMFVPAEGGSYEFEYFNETFFIWSVYDSSIPPVRSPFSTRLFKTVNSMSYDGPYYRISCDRIKRTWKIEVEPMALYDELETRQIYVLMWTSSHDYKFVFHFEQSNELPVVHGSTCRRNS